MTKRETTAEETARKLRAAEQLQARALRSFGQTIFAATAAYERELKSAGEGEYADIKIRDIGTSQDYRLAASIAAFLGSAFLRGGSRDRFDLAHDTRRTLQRLHAALRPRVDGRSTGEAVELAESIVGEFAVLYADAVSGDPRPPPPEPFTDWMTGEDLARSLALMLGIEVHPAFGALKANVKEISELLARFTPGKGRKAKKGEPSKITAAGILCELNKLPKDARGKRIYPLGKGLNVNGVDRAIDRFRK